MDVNQKYPDLKARHKGPALQRRQRPERIPLSYSQQRLWFIDRLEGMSAQYNLQRAFRLRGELDREALRRTINVIVERHESLRTRFEELDGEPTQVIEPELRMEVPEEDVSGIDAAEQRDRVMALISQEAKQPFDLRRGPVLRMRLLKLGERDHILLRTMHHIVSDGWSQGVLNREFQALYEAFCDRRENPLKALKVQYADFALWQREWLESRGLEEGLNYWRQQLAGIPEELALPTDRPRPEVQTFDADACQIVLGVEWTTALKRLAEANQATLYMTLLAAFGLLAARYTGQDDIVLGSPIANRQDPQLEEMIGFFVNTLVMRLQVKEEMSFQELLRTVRKTALEAYSHQDVPFERLVEELNPERTLSRSSVVQVGFALQNAPRVEPRMRGLEVTPIARSALQVHIDLEVYALEQSGEIRFNWVYNRDLFDRWRIEQMARHYLRILEIVSTNPTLLTQDIQFLDQTDLDILGLSGPKAWNSSTGG
jgi:hypothetical protein